MSIRDVLSFDIAAAIRECEELAACRTPEERRRDEECRERLRFDAALYLVRGTSARGRALGAAHLLQLQGAA